LPLASMVGIFWVNTSHPIRAPHQSGVRFFVVPHTFAGTTGPD